MPSLERVLVHCRDAARRAAFCREHDCEEAGSAREAGACDVVVTATTSDEPVLHGEWLRDGAFVCAVGANAPASRELDDAVLRRAAFVCTDARAQAQVEAGDLIEPVGRGVLDWSAVHELQDVVAGRCPAGRATKRSRCSSRTGSRPGTSPLLRASSSSRGNYATTCAFASATTSSPSACTTSGRSRSRRICSGEHRFVT